MKIIAPRTVRPDYSGKLRLLSAGSCAFKVGLVCVTLCLCSDFLNAQTPPAAPNAPAPAGVTNGAPSPSSNPAPADATRAFDAARKAFQDGNPGTARKFFAEFIDQHPQSDRVPEALLYQARATLSQGQVDEALALLEGRIGSSGRFTDEYRYWMGECLLRKEKYAAAAEQFALLLKGFPASARRLETAYGEARARFKLGDWVKVVELLQTQGGSFRQAAAARPKDDLVVSGDLMLVEALLELRNHAEAEKVVNSLSNQAPTTEMKWRQGQALCRVLLEAGKFPAALSQSSNALAAAALTGSPSAVAESIQTQASILSRLNLLPQAAQVYERNLAESTPTPRRFEALLQLIRLHLAQDQFAQATQRLELLINSSAATTNSDVPLLTYGEVFLRQYAVEQSQTLTNAAAGVSTNLLTDAVDRFDRLIRSFPLSRLTGLAHLYRGWALWAQDRSIESQESFRAAIKTLPYSEDQAVAQFKLAETFFKLRDLTNAGTEFRIFIDRYSELPRVQNTLYDQGLLYLARIGFEMRDKQGATSAMEKLLAWQPKSSLYDSRLLLMGRRLTLLDQPEEARSWLSRISDESAQKPVAELVIARSFAQQGNWTNAYARYAEWLARFTNATDLKPKAEFNFAWTTYQSGQESNAYALFTNFVTLYATNDLAPLVEFWIGDYFLRQQRYTNAEIQFRRIYQSTNLPPASELAYLARMQEGRAAFARQGFNNAHEIFSQIVNDKPPYPDLVARAYFALADCLWAQASLSTNAFAKYAEAAKAFGNITFLYGTNEVAPKAWGNLGNCLLQLAQQNPKSYQEVTNAYQQAILHPLASIADKSRAEVGLGIALRKFAETFAGTKERQPILEAAKTHFMRVLYEKNVTSSETPDAFWQRQAGLEAARLAEVGQDWMGAIGIYERLKQLIPQLGADLDRRILRASAAKRTRTQP